VREVHGLRYIFRDAYRRDKLKRIVVVITIKELCIDGIPSLLV
jgi:hypothetical protein